MCTSSTHSGTILAPTFGGGANSLVTEMLGDEAIISSDFGGNPPYEKMKEVARICFKHWLAQSNVIVHHRWQVEQYRHLRDFPRDGRRAARALQRPRPSPVYVVVGRGGPNLVRGMGAMRDTLDALGLPYRMFGFDSDMSEVVQLRAAHQRLDEGRRPRAGGPTRHRPMRKEV